MQIAPNFESSKWKTLRLDDANSSDWGTAISVLDGRIRERYIDPADMLIDIEKNKSPTQCRFGFTILAIDCLLVETFGAFLFGLKNTNNCSRKTFCKFLTTRIRDIFNGSLANKFFEDFRCGILHQAETGGSSKVWSVGEIVQEIDGGLIVNRNKFHKRLKKEFTIYLEELSDPMQKELRSNFRKKMKSIARV